MEPRLTAVLNMVSGFDAIRKTIRHIAAQTVRDQIELIIVTTPGQAPQVDDRMLTPIGSYRVLTVESVETAAAGWAAGIRIARAPVVVLAEDHSYPDPQWARVLIEAHNQDYDAVGPAIRNANPASLVSWANYLLCFVEWFLPERDAPVRFSPSHNTSYKAETLRAYDRDLEQWLNPERILHADLGAKGRRLLLAAEAATDHVNISRLRSYLAHSFHGGRVFGVARAANWPAARAWIQAAAFPLVPLVRISRIMRLLDTPEKRRASRFWPALPLTMLGLLCHAVGEAVGYVGGAGNSPAKYMSFEIYRGRHVRAADAPLLADLTPRDAKAVANLPIEAR